MRCFAELIVVVGCLITTACSRDDKGEPRESQIQSTDEPVSEQEAIAADIKAVYDAILLDVLTNHTFGHSREFYGTPGDKRFALVTGEDYGIPWPDSYAPSVDGYVVSRVLEGAEIDDNSPRLLGIRLDKFNLEESPTADEPQLLGGRIAVTLLNAGGSGGGATPIGGCTVYYDAKRDGDKWTIMCQGALDP